MAVSAHDDKVSLSPFSFCHQPGPGLAAAALDPMKDGVDSMMLEVVDRIDTENRLFLGWALAGRNHDRDLLRLVQIRHAFPHGCSRLASNASVRSPASRAWSITSAVASPSIRPGSGNTLRNRPMTT